MTVSYDSTDRVCQTGHEPDRSLVSEKSPVYLDCNATAPLDPSVQEAVSHWFCKEIGNAGSRTHAYGLAAKRAVQRARDQVAGVVGARDDEVLFTSGATESNNIAILGLAAYGKQQGRTHLVSTEIEHKAVLEPLEALKGWGFEVSLVSPDQWGMVSADSVEAALRPDTLLVSMMQVNNETGVRFPIEEMASRLASHEAFFHVDAAQGFGKELPPLRSSRIDLISISSHKIFGPVGVGALISRRRGFKRIPLQPLTFGGGQERGLRPGTIPVPLVVGFGLAADLARANVRTRLKRVETIRQDALDALAPLDIRLHSRPDQTLPHVLNLSVPGVDSEALMLALKDVVAISNGSACTSQDYKPSHVLEAMNLTEDAVFGAVRLSWCHMTPDVDWEMIAQRIRSLR